MDIKSYSFNEIGVKTLGLEAKELNWPVVYQIHDGVSIYIGETTNLQSRMQQHLKNVEKTTLDKFTVVYDARFNKSAALDLESQLIQWFSGEGIYTMLNRNNGLVDHDYFEKDSYRESFKKIWEELKKLNIASKSIKEIENSGLFKFSPYKQLNDEQLRVVSDVLREMRIAFESNSSSFSIVTGHEGTGKSIVLMFLIKLIRDIQVYSEDSISTEESDSVFEEYFSYPVSKIFKDKKIAFVVPNTSLRGSIEKVFRGINNLKNDVDVLSPIEFGANTKNYDITFVDEAHLLKISNQEVRKANREKVDVINDKIFGDGKSHTELDWVLAKSLSVVMVYGDQRIRQNNITPTDLPENIKFHELKSQIRSRGGEPFIDYLRDILSNSPPEQFVRFDNFEFKLFNDFKVFVKTIMHKEELDGLSRIVAGFAWEWKSYKNKEAYDISIDGIELRWNSTLKDFVGTEKSKNEVGSIYTIQGSDLNYCGVIIGNDLKYDKESQKIYVDRSNYFDRGAKKRNRRQLDANIEITDKDLLEQIVRTYRILMNRSIKGTYIYVCDSELRKYLSKYIEIA